MHINLLIIAIVSFAYCGYSQLVCYVCNGESSTSGKYCTNDNICVGNSCVFDAQLPGQWSAGCSNETIAASTTLCIVDVTAAILTCTCGNNFCNKVEQMSTILHSKLPNGTVFVPALPNNLTMECFECGVIYVSEAIGTLNVTCDQAHSCNGSLCVTKRGQYPHSYCATDWDPVVEGCVSRPGEDEVCACKQPFCNFPYDPQGMTSESTTTTATPTSGITAATSVTTTSDPTIVSNTTTTALATTTTSPPTVSNTTTISPNGTTAGPPAVSNTTTISPDGTTAGPPAVSNITTTSPDGTTAGPPAVSNTTTISPNATTSGPPTVSNTTTTTSPDGTTAGPPAVSNTTTISPNATTSGPPTVSNTTTTTSPDGTTAGPPAVSNTTTISPDGTTAGPPAVSNTTTISPNATTSGPPTVSNTTTTTSPDGTTAVPPAVSNSTTTSTDTTTVVITTTSAIASNSTPANPTTTPSADTTLPSPCTNGQFGKNPQMVSTSEALKQLIINRFGNSSPAVQHFINDINQHICSYSGP